MQIIPNPERGQLMPIALIDPKKKFGESGQFNRIEGDTLTLAIEAGKARALGLEIRWYYKDLKSGDEAIASQIIVTETPPGHIQPFHTHHTLHEFSVVHSGCLLLIESDTLTEEDEEALRAQGTLLHPGGMVIQEAGIRHTVMNPEIASYCVFSTVQTARVGIAEFPKDWHRDNPGTKSNVVEIKQRA